MNWKKIDKKNSTQPKGHYNQWKEQIAKECNHSCIYCSIEEAKFGGIDNFHIEHFRPKSKFKELTNDIKNLYYSCPICNRFKSNDWPNEPDDLNKICYPDPSEHDYKELFKFNSNNFKLKGKFVSTVYMTEKLYLNRTQLLYERKEKVLQQKEKGIIDWLKRYRNLMDCENREKYISLIEELMETIQKRRKVRPYQLKDIRR